MIAVRIGIFTLLLALCSITATAQRYFFENLSAQQGLASKVYCTVQGIDGLIWLGTEAGISSYDGISVTNYGIADGVAASGVRSLLVDDEGMIWAGHMDGSITHFNGRKFRTLKIGAGLKTAITGLLLDREGNVLVGTIGEGLWVLGTHSPEGNEIPAQRLNTDGPPLDRVLAMALSPDGSISIVEDGGSVFGLKNGKRTEIVVPGQNGVFRPTSIFWDEKGGLWIGTQGGGAFYRPRSDASPVRYDITNGLHSNTVICFGADGIGQVWIGTLDGGAACVGVSGVRNYDLDNGLHARFIRSLVRDREGNMLIATNESGLDIFKGDRFVSYGEADGLSDPKVFAVMEDQRGRTWFGTNAGIVILGKGEEQRITVQQGQLPTNFIRSLKEDDKGQVWIGTENAGLLRYDSRSGKAFVEIEVSGSLAENKVTALEIGQPGEIWVGGINGVRRYVPGSGTVPTVYTGSEGLAGNNTTAIFRDRGGRIWVGSTVGGISRIDNGVATRIDLGRSFAASCFTQDVDGRIWVGTEGQGIIVLMDGKEVQRFTTEEGLLSNTIKALGRDGSGHVWIGTNKGLNKWRHKKQGFIAFTERAGFTGIEVKPNAVCALASGGILFGTTNGATRVGNEKESEKNIPPLVTIRAWKVNLEDRPLVMDMSLDHTERNVRIVYGTVALSDPGAVRYQYRLEGLEEIWQPVTTSTEANYPALPAGNYVFQVRAMDRTGEWTDPPAEFRFTMLPPWYRSWWFYTALAMALAIILFSYIKVRERQLKLRNQVLERKVEERTAEVVAQSKEIEGQKGRIEDLLLNILPKEISEELKMKGKATARRHEAVTVMFTDMKGFTKIAEKMTPEQLVNELDECFIQFDSIIGRYGIEKIKTIGDSYMCASGIPTPDPYHAVRLVLAALEVRGLMERLHNERTAKGERSWALRIGLHSGPVVAGVVGKRKFAYDIWGDAVNTASRMESSGTPGEVNISGVTYELVKDWFECEHRGAIDAKNKGRIDMYFVRRIKPAFSDDANGTVANATLMAQLGIHSGAEQHA
ncbi:MAG: hypothetical protein IPO56_08965 [Flavobacteriales bacterium]|nr:hypothetical protein [Flavobacteriales bacterium]